MERPAQEMVGLCVIGTGIGRRFIERARERGDVRVASVCASRVSRVDDARLAYDIPFGAVDFRKAIDRPDVDLVVVASPDKLHYEQASFALECGKHVLVEKPITTTVDDARRLVEQVDRSGLTFVAGHNYRFIPQFAALQASVARGEIGHVYLGEGSYVQDLWAMADRGADYWRFRDPQDMLLGAAVHLVDLLLWTMGTVREVHAYANHRLPFYPADENYVVNLQFHTGAIGRLVVALGSRRQNKFTVTFTVHGDGGSATANNKDAAVALDCGQAPTEAAASIPVESGVNAIAAEFDHFLNCVRTGQPPLADVRDGARAVAVCAAAARSVTERRATEPAWDGNT